MTHDTPELPPTLVDVSDLVDTPGATRPVRVVAPLPEGFDVPLTEFTGEVVVDGNVDALVDGVLVRGTVEAAVEQRCAACLVPLTPTRVSASVAELYSDPAEADDPADVEQGYVIHKGVIDLDSLLRDTLAEAVIRSPHCRPDCAGLCPTCGVNLNEASCDCADHEFDDRWSALANLKLE